MPESALLRVAVEIPLRPKRMIGSQRAYPGRLVTLPTLSPLSQDHRVEEE